MRSILLISVAAALVACSDDQHSTAPPNPRSASTTRQMANGTTETSRSLATAQGKPAGGFTTLITVMTPLTDIPALQNSTVHADCPQGTTVVGGGFEYGPFVVNAPPLTIGSVPHNNGWWVEVNNEATGATYTSIHVWALCLS